MLSLVLNDGKTKRPSGAPDLKKKSSFGILFGSLPGSLSIGIRPSGDELCTTGDTTAERLYDIRMSLVTISFHSDTSVKSLKEKKKKSQNQTQNATWIKNNFIFKRKNQSYKHFYNYK